MTTQASNPRVSLAHLPTPLWHHPALDALVGCEVWVKRDDMTGGAEAGNKLRKLEYLLYAAQAEAATVVLSCGGAQSNHARATALCARRLGLRSVLFLRNASEAPVQGNLLLDHLAGAEVRSVTPEQYRERDRLMAEAALALNSTGERAYVIPEGGSNGLGSLGYVQCAAEVRAQLDQGLAAGVSGFDWVVCACGSGGTVAGLLLGVAAHGIAQRVHAVAVCDTRSYFEPLIARIVQQARALEPGLPDSAPLVIDDSCIGPGYGVMSREQLAFLVTVARQTGLILDPVYSGKALFGLAQLQSKPGRVLFIHTGGLPGLLAQATELSAALSA